MSDADIQDALVKLNEVVEKSDHSQTDSLDDAQVSVTAAAVSKIKEFIAQQHKKGLRITVHPGGCSGFKYGMTLEDTSSKDDIVIEQQGIQVFIDKTSMMKLNGASIDYVDSLQGAGFKISNPQAKASCGCGNSFR
ncbi:TPA: iron-sulfur cluster assembly accessory protein [Candidatus Woesearchaeota archaeon]|nr:iron-sulfur cluster assembly accessory protein [Candidatus Woesearchaeota archaeon]HIH13067.1 iron-sulfur cluster assembly accessory protein [Candidatus Woesearchaeota archaeon]